MTRAIFLAAGVATISVAPFQALLAEPDDVFRTSPMSNTSVSASDFSSNRTAPVADRTPSVTGTTAGRLHETTGITLTGFDTAVANAGSYVATRLEPFRQNRARNRSCCRDECHTWYMSLSAGHSSVDGGSSGITTGMIATFGNWGDAHDDEYFLGGAVGCRTPFELFGACLALRCEVEAMDRHDMNFVTNSAPGFPGPPTLFYRANVGDIWTLTNNFRIDIPITNDCGIYTGFGLGVAGHQTVVNDNFHIGTGRNIDYSYMIGGGVTFRLDDGIYLDLGWRFVDLGEAHVKLSNVIGGGPAGDYVLDLNSNELIATIRIDLY